MATEGITTLTDCNDVLGLADCQADDGARDQLRQNGGLGYKPLYDLKNKKPRS